jgi:hypothetical protein
MPTVDLKQFDWARSLLVEKFKREINAYLTDELVIDRVKKKATNGDSLYEAMFGGLDRDEYLSMITHWSIGQGIGVRLRIWIEDAIKELVLYQKEKFGREIEAVYTHGDLRQGRLVP